MLFPQGDFMNITDYYVYGYTERESSRLKDQENCLNEMIHHDTIFPENSIILEAGCVGRELKLKLWHQ